MCGHEKMCKETFQTSPIPLQRLETSPGRVYVRPKNSDVELGLERLYGGHVHGQETCD